MDRIEAVLDEVIVLERFAKRNRNACVDTDWHLMNARSDVIRAHLNLRKLKEQMF